MSRRFLGVDFGAVRIGIAVAVSRPEVITPRKPLAASGKLSTDADALAKLAVKEEVSAIVLGLPLQDDANDGGKMQRVCHKLAEELRKRGQIVHLQDETLSSVEAESHLRQVDFTAAERRKLRDGEAAAIILERFLAAQADEPNS